VSRVGLTSGSLIGLAGFFATGAFALTLGMWRRLATPGHVLARLALLLCAQVSVMLVLFLSVNKSFGFFASWSDLFGTNDGTGQIVAPRHPGGHQPRPIQSQGAGEVAARTPPGWPPAGPGSLPAPGALAGSRYGLLSLVRVNGARSGISASAYVYLPPQYFWPAQAGQTFGVVVVISGRVASPGAPYSAASLAATAADEIAAGRARPAIYVMLSPAVAGGRDRGCLDVPGGPLAATFFSQDLTSAIESSYPVSHAAAGWTVLGDPAGGYCALSLAMRHSDRFGAATAPLAGYGAPPGSAGTRPGTTGWWLSGGSQQLARQNDLAWRLRNLPPPPVTLCFLRGGAAGQPGSAHKGAAAAFLALLKPPARVSQLSLTSGPGSLAPVIDRITAQLSPGAAP
jgi:Putative esterase